jgi:hypothetical protein
VARDLAATLLGSAVDYAIRVPAFAGNQVFRIGRGNLVAFLKLADDSDLKRELAVPSAPWPAPRAGPGDRSRGSSR